MIPYVDAALQAVVEGLKLANTITARKWIDKIADLKKDLLEEESKGYNANDAKCERLESELKIACEASATEISLAGAKK